MPESQLALLPLHAQVRARQVHRGIHTRRTPAHQQRRPGPTFAVQWSAVPWSGGPVVPWSSRLVHPAGHFGTGYGTGRSPETINVYAPWYTGTVPYQRARGVEATAQPPAHSFSSFP